MNTVFVELGPSNQEVLAGRSPASFLSQPAARFLAFFKNLKNRSMANFAESLPSSTSSACKIIPMSLKVTIGLGLLFAVTLSANAEEQASSPEIPSILDDSSQPVPANHLHPFQHPEIDGKSMTLVKVSVRLIPSTPRAWKYVMAGRLGRIKLGQIVEESVQQLR